MLALLVSLALGLALTWLTNTEPYTRVICHRFDPTSMFDDPSYLSLSMVVWGPYCCGRGIFSLIRFRSATSGELQCQSSWPWLLVWHLGHSLLAVPLLIFLLAAWLLLENRRVVLTTNVVGSLTINVPLLRLDWPKITEACLISHA